MRERIIAALIAWTVCTLFAVGLWYQYLAILGR